MDTGIRTDTTGCVTITIGMCIVTITIMHGTHGTHTDTINIASQWCFWHKSRNIVMTYIRKGK